MVSEEKMIHIVHLLIDGLEKAGIVSYPDKPGAMKEAKRAALGYLSNMEACSEIARKRISSQKSPPPENSRQWDTLYAKYYEEELQKKGG
ncbi:DUF507 family protein [bacterium]|nr:DUF507 family protein [bacterium]